MGADDKAVTFTQDLIDVVVNNPGLTMSIGDLQIAERGEIKMPRGCIKELRFGNKDNDLVQVIWESGYVLKTSNASNLNDFRETFKEAACCGHGISACHFINAKRISMVNLTPCQCKCDRKPSGPVITGPPNLLP